MAAQLAFYSQGEQTDFGLKLEQCPETLTSSAVYLCPYLYPLVAH
jgi:hypothetical protein